MAEDGDTAYTIARLRGVLWPAFRDLTRGCNLTTALIFSPDACRLARIEAETGEMMVIDDGKEAPAAPARSYEIRAFGPAAELRWRRDGAEGVATLIADGTVAPPDGAESTTGRTLARLRRRYRVWGEPVKGAKCPESWRALGNARIGTLYVPCELAGELVLTASEYVVSGKSGNAVVLFERLVGFASAGGGVRE
jgi:CRISPR-associated protein (TIGR03984 family)